MIVRLFLSKLLATITGHPRYFPESQWSSLWTRNIFGAFEYLFGRRFGIRAESSACIQERDGKLVTVYRFFTAEAFISHWESVVRNFLKNARFEFEWVSLPQLQYVNNKYSPSIKIPSIVFAIAYTGSTADKAYSAAASSLTITMTPSGSDRFVIQWALTGDGNFLLTPKVGGSGGSDMTVITTAVVSGQYHQGYYYVNPPASSTGFYQPVSGTRGFDTSIDVYSGVKQDSGALDSFAAIASGAVPRTFSTTVVASNCWLVSMARNVTTGVVSPSTGTTGRTDGTLHDSGDSGGTVGTGSQSMAWTDSSGNVYGIIASVAPAGAATINSSFFNFM